MQLKGPDSKPIFIQVAEWVEDEILIGNIKDGDKIFSQLEFAKVFNINHLTAAKGVSLLESRGILEKKRGLGMFVESNAKAIIHEYRRNLELVSILDDLVAEANILGISYERIIELIHLRMKGDKDTHD